LVEAKSPGIGYALALSNFIFDFPVVFFNFV
jgi:hypothetical protein